MSFVRPITRFVRFGRDCARVDVPLTVLGPAGAVTHYFRFDTGCDITTVSEDVATKLGLPAGGAPVRVTGSTAAGVGRLVTASFRFPPDLFSGTPAPVQFESWIVVSGGSDVALLSLYEVHARYQFWTDDTDVYFTDR